MVIEVGLSDARIEMSNSKTLIELAADRRMIIECFESDDISDDAKNMGELVAVERQIVDSAFRTDADFLTGCRMLVDMGDQPHAFDNFKVALFLRMQEYAIQ